MKNLIFLGAPGAGKGTNAKRVAHKFNIPHISTGDMFREAIKNGTKTGLLAKSYMDQGLLVPDEVTINIVKERLAQDDCKNGYLLDGFPRTLVQAEALDTLGKEINRPINLVINLDVPEEVLKDRICGRRVCKNCGTPYHIKTLLPKVEGVCDNCGGELIQRKDDNEEALKTRLDEYHHQTEPLINFYSKLGVLFDVDGTKELDALLEDITNLINK